MMAQLTKQGVRDLGGNVGRPKRSAFGALALKGITCTHRIEHCCPGPKGTGCGHLVCRKCGLAIDVAYDLGY